MSRRVALGVGFRKACTADRLVDVMRLCLERAGAVDADLASAEIVVATIAEKDRPVLHAAAACLGLEVVVLAKQALGAAEDRITVASEKVRACFGISSVAEAAALTAAGRGARLIVSRIALADATGAVARAAGSGEAEDNRA